MSLCSRLDAAGRGRVYDVGEVDVAAGTKEEPQSLFRRRRVWSEHCGFVYTIVSSMM